MAGTTATQTATQMAERMATQMALPTVDQMATQMAGTTATQTALTTVERMATQTVGTTATRMAIQTVERMATQTVETTAERMATQTALTTTSFVRGIALESISVNVKRAYAPSTPWQPRFDGLRTAREREILALFFALFFFFIQSPLNPEQTLARGGGAYVWPGASLSNRKGARPSVRISIGPD
eukprot:scaffold25494_cov60-Cyclotella_meneghiniana.AAC.1